MYNAAVQGVGFAGMALCAGCFFCKDSTRLLLLQLLGNSLFILQFVLLRAYDGCLILAVLMGGSLSAVFRLRGAPWAVWRGWPWLWSSLAAAACAVSWRGWTSLLPCVSTIASVLINWTGNAGWIRVGKLIVVGPGWMAYDWLAGSFGGVVSEAIGWCSSLASLFYYRRRERRSGGEIDPV